VRGLTNIYSKSTLVSYSTDRQNGAFPNTELQGAPRNPSQQHSSVQGQHAESLSLSHMTLGCWVPNVLLDHDLLYHPYEEMSPAGR